MKYIITGILVILIGIGAYFSLDYLGLTKSSPQFKDVIQQLGKDVKPVDFMVEEVASDLFVPWSIVFTSEKRVLIAERSGSIRVVSDGQLLKTPFYTFTDVSSEEEAGLMGLDKDPNYSLNKYLYACYAYKSGEDLRDRVVRLKDAGDSITFDKVLLDDIPAARYHAGCRVKFGPDGKLYVTTGDATEKDLAQDLSSLAGKILRMNIDGSIPTDNPFENSYIYSYGHRNSQGLSWDLTSGVMFSTEHGPSVFDGPAGGDEINIIKPGKNYGWPVVSHERTASGMEDAKEIFTPAVAPASALIYSGKMFPQFKGNLFFGGLKGEGLYRAILNGNEITGVVKVEEVNFGRIRDVVESPIGEIWFVTSNRDGRGKLRDGDDRIYKLLPK